MFCLVVVVVFFTTVETNRDALSARLYPFLCGLGFKHDKFMFQIIKGDRSVCVRVNENKYSLTQVPPVSAEVAFAL